MVNEFSVKNMVILDSGGNYLYVKEVAGSFIKIGAPCPKAQRNYRATADMKTQPQTTHYKWQPKRQFLNVTFY